jgi:pyruvate dehydrogenase E1 component alpha subunit
MGAIWSLPVVYVVENNLYSASTPIFEMVRLKRLSDRAAGYGIPGVTVDGNDVLEVFDTARKAVERARAGAGPTLVECMTYRITGHSRRDPCNYQPEEERKEALKREPLQRFAEYLRAGLLTRLDLKGFASRSTPKSNAPSNRAWQRRIRDRKRRLKMSLSDETGELWLT